jgi:hypothetical protein
MRRAALAAVAASLLVLLVAPPASGSHDPSGAPFDDEDFVVGSFSTGVATTTVDAHSGPSGENPSGEITVQSPLGSATGSVSCLNVAGNRATVGTDLVGGFLVFFEDNDGAGQDRFVPVETGAAPSVCPPDPLRPLVPISGDITVHDAPALPMSKEQCKRGGWRNFGTRFKNEGQCVAFVQRRPQP